MKANYLHLYLGDDGPHMKIPITLDQPVYYFRTELNEVSLIDKILNRNIRFFVIDQRGKEHASKKYKVVDASTLHRDWSETM